MRRRRRKLPWMPFFPLDWLADTRSLTNPQKGIWIDLICYMWMAESRGKLTGNWDSIARMVGDISGDEIRKEIEHMCEKKIFVLEKCNQDVIIGNQNVNIMSRRIIYDEKRRQSIRNAVKKHRIKERNHIVTRMKRGEVRSHISEVIKDKEETKTKEVVALKNGATTPQGDFVLSFGKTYEAITKQPFKAAKEDYVIVARLIRDHGYGAVVSKAEMLGQLCNVRTSWFTKAGWADYTVKNLSRNWNSILESSNQSADKEFAEEMKRQEARDARINDAINR